MEYEILKSIHIVSATIFFGTGIGSAFFMFMVNRNLKQTRDLQSAYFVTKNVVIADWIFTTPAVIVQLFSGLRLANIQGYELTDFWIFSSLLLYFFAVLCWLPVVLMQIKMRNILKEVMDKKSELPNSYSKMYLYWIILGSLAFPAIIIIFYLMVAKSV